MLVYFGVLIGSVGGWFWVVFKLLGALLVLLYWWLFSLGCWLGCVCDLFVVFCRCCFAFVVWFMGGWVLLVVRWFPW